MKILLMCANGLSTGILMNKMNQWAEQNNEDLEVKAIPIDDYLSVYKDYDVLLVGPQMRYKIKDVQKAVTDRPSAVINPSDYALGNVENIIQEVKRMIKEGKKMDKFMHFVEDKMSPIADKLGEQRHLSAMQKGFMTVLPLIFVGAVFMVIANPPVTADMVKSGGVWSIFSGWFNFATKYKMAILVPYNMSMGLLALAVTFVIADNLATSYSMKGITNGLTALVVFLLVAAPANYLALADGTTPLLMNCTYLGAQGLFTAIIVALLTVEITRFCEIHNITIRLPEICPPALTNSFRTIVPMVINVSIFYILSLLSSNYLGMSIPALIEKVLATPVAAVNSVPGSIFLCAFMLLLWCCGVHGQMVTMALTAPITTAAFTANAALVAKGQAPIFHPIFMTLGIGFLGGTGNTLGLCILSCWKAKSQQLKAFGKATIVPSIFRISEPALFGAPIMFNPVLMLPFIANGLIVAILYWLACSFGLLTAPYLLISGTYPVFLSLFVYCLDWRVFIFIALMIPLTLAIWYPFFVAYDHSLCKKEEATKLAEEEA